MKKICISLIVLFWIASVSVVYGENNEPAVSKETSAGKHGSVEKLREAPKGPEEKKLGFLDVEVFDKAFDEYVGKQIEKFTKGAKLAIPEIPVFDSALDEFTKYSPFDFELGFTLTSKYIWRGQNLGPRASWQPYVKVSPDFEPFGNLCFTYWANVLKNADKNLPGSPYDTEHDFIFDYSFDFLALTKLAGVNNDFLPYLLKKAADFNFSTGLIYYHFPPSRTSTNEIYWTFTYNWPLHPYVSLVNDFGDGTGVWVETGVSHSFDLKLVTISSYLKTGYNHKQWAESSKLQTLEFGFSMPVPVGKHMKIEPFISYSKRLHKTYYYTTDSDGNEVGNILTKDEFFGGFKYTINF